MSRTFKDSKNYQSASKQQRQISVRAVRREQPDTRRLARALIQLVMAETEAKSYDNADPTPKFTKRSPDNAAPNSEAHD